MTYSAREGRERILLDVAEAAAALMGAQEALGEAHEQLDDAAAGRLELELYGPVRDATKSALAGASAFAARVGMTFTRPAGEHHARTRGDGPREYVDAATALVARADELLAELQDSLLPVEVGDTELREALAATRRTIAPLAHSALEFERTLGR
ncbi:MAG TPA: hypothetical protein VMA83_06725 [Solirubrobacteraceae bacterium]|nr:hypothetical protein [Solirubrobacteraceae bacterium]